MEIRTAHPTTGKLLSNKTIWTGRVISYLCILFLLFDAIMKIIRESHSVEGSVALGWPDTAIIGIGIILLVSTILYIIPATAILGAILLTGYLGGAIAIMFRAGQPYYFPVIVGILLWTGLWIRDEKLRLMIPFTRE